MIHECAKRLLVGILLAWPSLAAAAEPSAAERRAAAVAPWIDEQTCLIAAMDCPTLAQAEALAAITELLKKLHVAPAMEGGGLRMFADFAAGGVNEAYLIFSLADVPERSPLLVVPVAEEHANSALAAVRGSGASAEVWRGVVLAGDNETVERAKRMQPVARPEIAAALEAAEGGEIQVLFVPAASQRQVIEAMLPRLPAEIGGGPVTIVTKGSRWISLSVSLKGDLAMRFVIQSDDRPAAEALCNLWSDVTRDVCRHPDVLAAMPDIKSPRALLTPRLADDRLLLELNNREQSITAFAAALRAPLAFSRAAAHRARSRQNLLTLGLAFLTYADRDGTFPAMATYSDEGRPLLSWRVHLLPRLGEEDLYRQFHLDEPWDSDHNRSLVFQMPAVFARPGGAGQPGHTPYLVPMGAGTALSAREETAYREFKDGTSDTILVVEADRAHEAVWTRPADFEYDDQRPSAGLVDARLGGLSVLFADGKVRFLKQDLAADTLRALFTRAGHEVVDYDHR